MILQADQAATERMLLALLENAVKYTPTLGRVELRSLADEGFAVIEVQDSGIGISEGDLPRIFDRFFRADQARSHDVPGSGLGLSIARWVVDAHRGAIEVSSQLGKGSLFRVRLPMAAHDGPSVVGEENVHSIPLPAD